MTAAEAPEEELVVPGKGPGISVSVCEVMWVNPSYLHTSTDETPTSWQHGPHLPLEGWAG